MARAHARRNEHSAAKKRNGRDRSRPFSHSTAVDQIHSALLTAPTNKASAAPMLTKSLKAKPCIFPSPDRDALRFVAIPIETAPVLSTGLMER